MHTIIRYFQVGLAAALIVFLILTFSPGVLAEKRKFTACRNNTTSQCLTDLGVEIAMDARSLPPHLRAVEMLAQMGRTEDARVLARRVLSEKERPPADVEFAVNQRLASHRITAAIRAGETPKTAIIGMPDLKPSKVKISALDLLGRNPYGPSIGPRITPDERTVAIVSAMAELIVEMAEEEQERTHIRHLMDAAELQAALGNRTRATQLLEALPQTEDPRIHPSEELMRLVGSQSVLRLYRKIGGTRPHILLTAASAESDMGRATEYLERAFAAFSSEKRWPGFHWMERTVERAADLGLEELALELAHALADQAETAPSFLPVFSHITAARALMVAGADEQAVRDRLTLAQSRFPSNNNEVVGIGVVSGAIVWGSSGLDAQARREIANLRARLGETGTAIQIMDGIDDPVFAWNDMLSAEIPVEHLNGLLDAASVVLAEEDHAYVRAQHAQELLLFGSSEEQRSWARATATALLQTEQLDGDRAISIYTTLTRVGAKLEDQSIQRLALAKMAEAALRSRNYRDLITAGFHWHESHYSP